MATKTDKQTDKIKGKMAGLQPRSLGRTKGVKRRVNRVQRRFQIKKPPKLTWFRVMPIEGEYSEAVLFEDKETQKWYIVDPEMHEYFTPSQVVDVWLVPYITRQGKSIAIWPLKQPLGNSWDSWYETAIDARDLALNEWTRMEADQDTDTYVIDTAVDMKVEPSWPEMSYEEIIEVLCKSDYIDSEEHPVIKAFEGDEG